MLKKVFIAGISGFIRWFLTKRFLEATANVIVGIKNVHNVCDLVVKGDGLGLVYIQPGDMPVTCADTSAMGRDFGFLPFTPLEDGLHEFAKWHRGYYGVGA